MKRPSCDFRTNFARAFWNLEDCTSSGDSEEGSLDLDVAVSAEEFSPREVQARVFDVPVSS